MKIALPVTGSAKHIGSDMIPILPQAGHWVVVLYSLSNSFAKSTNPVAKIGRIASILATVDFRDALELRESALRLRSKVSSYFNSVVVHKSTLIGRDSVRHPDQPADLR